MENADYMLHVAGTGVYIEMDTIGRYKYHSDEEEVRLIRMLLDHGHEDRILLGLDTTRKRMKSYGGDMASIICRDRSCAAPAVGSDGGADP